MSLRLVKLLKLFCANNHRAINLCDFITGGLERHSAIALCSTNSNLITSKEWVESTIAIAISRFIRFRYLQEETELSIVTTMSR